jgi:hypothetical protein
MKSKECIFIGYYETTKGYYRLSDPNEPIDTFHARDVMFTEEKMENSNRSVMNDSHKDEMPMHLLSNEGSEVVQGQTGDSNHSETTEETDSTGEQGERGSKTSESDYREDSTVTGNKVSSDDELTQYHSQVNQDKIQSVERRTTIRMRQPKKWVSHMVLNKAMSAQMTEPKTIQEALSIPNTELWKSAMQEYDSLLEMELEAGRPVEKPED